MAARCLSCIADVLVCMAGGKGGLRSGPAANKAWRSAYSLLEQGDLRGGVQALAAQRKHWLSRWASLPVSIFVFVGGRWSKCSLWLTPAGRTCWFERHGTTRAPARCSYDKLWCHHKGSSPLARVRSRPLRSGRKWSVRPDWTWQVGKSVHASST